MKKIYVTPLNKVRELSTAEGILLVTSDDDMNRKGFDTNMSGEGAGDEDFAREHKGNTNIWDQGW